MSASAFLALLEAGDVDALRSAWAKVAPHLPQPDTREKAEIVLHMTRTARPQLTFRARAYSHAWLIERALPSQLPDELKAKAERMYSRATAAVGISVTSKHPVIMPIVNDIRQSMEHAVLEAEADGKLEDAAHVRTRMLEARERTYRTLLGR